MKAKKRKIIPSYIYQKAKTPDHCSSPEVIKKKLKFQNTIAQDGTRLMDTLPQDADETLSGTQLAVEGKTAEHLTTSANELTFIRAMTKEELNTHIQKCLEMSSENKITPKNAFALQLIDCMNLLLQKEDFSVMACTLDAGQKIYAYRVDSLHQQVTKLAEEVINNQKNKKVSDGENVEEESDATMKKEKRHVSKKNILTTVEGLRRTLQCKDPKERFIKMDGLPGAIMTSVRRDPADLSFTLEQNVPFWHDWENYKPHSVNGTVTIPDCEISRDKNESRENNNLLQFTPIQEKADTQVALQEEMSDDIVMDDIFNNEALIDADGSDDNKSEDGEVDVISTAIKRLHVEAEENNEICTVPSRSETMKIIFNQVSDYHYLNMEKAYYWAGPEFWKRPKPTSMNCKGTTKVSRKKKDPNVISYTGPEAERKMNQPLKKGSKLTSKTIMRWKMKNVTYPTDLKIGVGHFLDLFHVSGVNELEDNSQSSEEELNKIEEEISSDDNNNSIQDDVSDTLGSQDQLNSCFYESAPENCVSPDYDDPLNSAFYDAGLTHRSETETETVETGKIIKVQFSKSDNCDTNLVPVPKTVNFKPIKYKTKPIRVDMQHLKRTMWEIINEGDDKNELDKKENIEDNLEAPQRTMLSDVLKKLPNRLEKRTAEDLSTGMTLLALLTLANENNLSLKNTEDYSDVKISLENENLFHK